MELDKTMDISKAMKIVLSEELPPYPKFFEGIRRAPSRGYKLTSDQTKLALKNALRYIPPSLHEKLATEFIEELSSKGRISNGIIEYPLLVNFLGIPIFASGVKAL